MNPADELARFRPDLLRFARLQLRDDQLAEDVVQEATIGARRISRGGLIL